MDKEYLDEVVKDALGEVQASISTPEYRENAEVAVELMKVQLEAEKLEADQKASERDAEVRLKQVKADKRKTFWSVMADIGKGVGYAAAVIAILLFEKDGNVLTTDAIKFLPKPKL